MVLTQALCSVLVLYLITKSESSYLPQRYYSSPRTYTDDNVYITDKYGQVVAVEPYWSRSAKSYTQTPVYTRRCYNCVARNVYYTEPYTRKVYVKDRFGNSVLVDPGYYNVVYRSEYYPSYRSGRRYSSSNEDYVYINDMYGRTRAVPKTSYLYDYAKGY